MVLLHHIKYLNSKKLILGSTSPRRSTLLKSLGLEFSVVGSNFQENLDKSTFKLPVDYVTATATHKAKEIFSRVFKDRSHQENQDLLIICADTIVVHGDVILEKPKSVDDALLMLTTLSGQQHSVFTAVALLFGNEKNLQKNGEGYWVHTFSQHTLVQFSQLSKEAINEYIQSGSPMDKAGGYGIQEATGGSFVEKIDGCYYNVTGFPLNKFCTELEKILKDRRF